MHSRSLSPGLEKSIHCTLLTALLGVHLQMPCIMRLNNVSFLAIFTSWQSSDLKYTRAITSLTWGYMSRDVHHKADGEWWGAWRTDVLGQWVLVGEWRGRRPWGKRRWGEKRWGGRGEALGSFSPSAFLATLVNQLLPSSACCLGHMWSPKCVCVQCMYVHAYMYTSRCLYAPTCFWASQRVTWVLSASFHEVSDSSENEQKPKYGYKMCGIFSVFTLQTEDFFYGDGQKHHLELV